tara:strand:- start:2679 stop:3881 length:1203 start_codon:yes stop_codon:yes gene_type:complete
MKKQRKIYPKVLIISEFYFNENTGGGILLKNLFQNYPKNKIFILHEDLNVNTGNSIKSYLLKKPNKTNNFLKKILDPFLIKLLINLKNFHVANKKKKVSSDLLFNLRQFKPDIIYTIFGNYGLMCLIKELKLKLEIPLVTHIMDNILATYSNKKKDYRIFRYLIDSSVTRIAINSKMSLEYKKIFGYDFEVLHNGINPKKIRKVNLKNKSKVITYIGSIFKNAQLNSLVEITKATKKLIEKNYDIKCFIYLPKNQKLIYESYFPKDKKIYIKNHNLKDNEYFKKISESSLLLLASNFDNDSIDYYKYSWPAKLGSYLMSKVPIFIYGPDKIYFVDDAKKKKWAYVENENSALKLEKSLKKILYDSNLRKQTLKCAIKKSKDFELNKIQNKFVKFLGSIET